VFNIGKLFRKGGKGMRKNFLPAAVLLGVILVAAYAFWSSNHNKPALAQSKQPTPAQRMAKYSPPKKKTTVPKHVRVSQVTQMNIVSEAANVLNVLPIDIITEMGKGKTLVQIAMEKGLTEADFNKKLTDFDTKIVNAAVKDGSISKQHADAINAGRADRIKNGMKESAQKAGSIMDMSGSMSIGLGE
jgi:hypothetical protein